MTREEAAEIVLQAKEHVKTCPRCTGLSFIISGTVTVPCPDCSGQGILYTRKALDAFDFLNLPRRTPKRDSEELKKHIEQVVHQLLNTSPSSSKLKREP